MPIGLALIALAATRGGPQIWEKTVAPGLVYRMEVDGAIPRVIHALRWSVGNTTSRATPELAGKTVYEEGAFGGRGTISQMVKESNAVGGINGDFFPFGKVPTGDPLGLMVQNGELLSTPWRTRAAFAWGPQGATMATASFTGSIAGEGGKPIELNGVNQECGLNETVLNTSSAGFAMSKPECLAVVIKMQNPTWSPSTVLAGEVEYALPEGTKISVPPGRAIVVAQGSKVPALASLRPGQRVVVRFATTGFDWLSYENAIGGGPMLVQKSKIDVDAKEEGFDAAFSAGRHPRSAVGKTKEGDLWFVEVDGRQETGSGVTLDEMAAIMLRLGCTEAMNLDGGGSSTLNVLGLTVNRPSDAGHERYVANGVLFFAPPGITYEGKLRLSVSSTIAADGTAQAHVFTATGQDVPNADIIWAASGGTWVDQGGLVRGLKAGEGTVFARVYGQLLTAKCTVKK